jgi:predicted ATPase
MITRWRLANFKSVRANTELELSPLTIFSGPNSSGKSTCLQSILLVSQTLSSKISSHSVVLNGPILRLGQYNDLQSSQSEDGPIEIQWECHPAAATSDDRTYIRSTRPSNAYWYMPDELLSRINCSITFDTDTVTDGELTQLQPRLSRCRIEVAAGDVATSHQAWVEMTRVKAAGGAATKAVRLGFSPGAGNPLGLDYDVSVDPQSARDIREEFTSGHVVGASLRHFLPIHLSIRFNIVDEEVNYVTSMLFDDARQVRRRQYYGREIALPPRVATILREHLGELAAAILDPRPRPGQQVLSTEPLPVRQFVERLRRLPPARHVEVRTRLKKIEPELTRAIREEISGGRAAQYGFTQTVVPALLSNAVTYLDDFFSRSVRYLGPLRDEPKPLYPLAPTVDPTDIGFKGEHTAAVLDLHKNARVSYLPSSNFEQTTISTSPVKSHLLGAVVDWATYMGVADGFLTRDLGKLGHELKVVSHGVAAPQDLTHVGVGVSQVLPILVVCLLAEADTTVIIEQPELHLHPRVQTRLADFFLSMVLLGKQCVIETHSEYIINRLRLRAASADGEQISRLVGIYFVEKKGGSSTFRRVVVSPYGSINEWPEGFFDQSQSEAEAILVAATMKRRTERSAK